MKSEVIQAVNIEQCVLGSIITDETLVEKLDELTEDMFSYNLNKDIIKAMKSLKKENKSLDIQTLATRLGEIGFDVKVSYLTNLAAISQSSAIETHIGILKEKALRRYVIENCTKLFERLGTGEDIDTSIFKFENDMKNILENESSEYVKCYETREEGTFYK